ncbi:NAD-dependent epimerase/dehydratase family protein [Antarcticibacterium flavum]|uniref:NAD-dependent epimerase/dehydratase family protein n=1 Tax=Antarcticibacterium flavum TaxID=2058175 RepID=A0A5B7X352_9FLAO|nr:MULTISPECIES: NAD-dependent epimerase/dehydratase family protein [Antarcticibacterium]MCM4161322.1 dihydroflavonol 4-reductase [Antarcticibacterium sp. W02-3]QCY69101.1 NAD-dependent epimerase/dehydratase family protein [Antarcticibacterium flavum]
MKTVGIIGGAGFIGSHITRKFLEKNYKVKVSVTSIQKSEKYEHLFNLENSINIVIRPLKLENREALGNFIEDCDIVIHSGTPFQLEVKDPQAELLDPTIIGTQNFLDSLLDAPQIKKVIFIASVAAWNTNFPLPAGGKTFLDSFDEQDVRFTSKESHPYCRAKYVANGVVEQFILDNPSLPFEITTVSPVMVMGKSLSKREDSTSTGIQSLIKNKLAPDDFFQNLYDNNIPFAMVDVEDVAQAVYNAVTTTGLHGKDYLLSSETYKVLDIHEMLNRREPKEKAQVVYKNNLAKKDLKLKFRPVRKTLNAW